MALAAEALYAAIAAWFAAGCLLSHLARRLMGPGVAEYFVADRKLTAIPAAMTYAATTYSAFMMVGLVGLTYKLGSSTLGFELTYLIGTVVLLVYFAPRIWAAGRVYGLITPPELLSRRFESRLVGAVATLICAVMIVPYASVQYMGIGYLVEGLTGGSTPFIVGALIVMVTVFAYAYWAGMRSVAWTDTLQAAIMMASSIALVLYVVDALLGGWQSYVVRLHVEASELLKVRWPLMSYLGLVVPWFFFALSNPQVFQRYYVPKDAATLRRMIAGFAVFGLIYTLICTQLGFMARLVVPGLAMPDKAMPELLARVPAALALATFIGILAAAVSTLNSIVLTLSSMVGRDIYRAIRPQASEEAELLVGKLFIPIFAAACFVFAMLRPGLIVILSAMASGGMLMLVPSIIAAFTWRRATAQGALASMVGGSAVVAVGYALKASPLGVPATIWGLATSTLLLILVSYLTRPPSIAGEFIERVGEELRAHNMD